MSSSSSFSGLRITLFGTRLLYLVYRLLYRSPYSRYTSIVPSNNTVLISAHYDSRGSFGSLRAPGADDDGSGTTGLLAIARAIGRKNIRFLTNVELVFFAGEEQGLLGSRAYAKELRGLDANFTMVIQADMIAYHEPV